MKMISKLVVAFIVCYTFQTSVNAQCKTVVKEGIAKLSPYTHNGQVNNITLKEGKPAEVHLSFYKGLYYKLQISSEKSLGKVNFRVLDENKKEVYNSTADAKADFWNFYSNSSQELIIELIPSEPKKGCAAVLVGMQVPKKSNPIRNL